jgi:hypothetical protein
VCAEALHRKDGTERTGQTVLTGEEFREEAAKDERTV